MAVFGQVPDNTPVIELSATDFSIERPFTLSVTLQSAATRPAVTFPDLIGLTKSGTTASPITSEVNGKPTVGQVITQDYLATAPGIYRLVPFTIVVNGTSIRSPGVTLTVRPVAGRPAVPISNTAALAQAEKGGAFLALSASQASIVQGQGVMLQLTFYAAENYPYELRFDQVEQQLLTITRRIRPPGAWEENAGISELKPRSITVKGRTFREFIMYRSTFYPLNSQTIRLPAVVLTMQRVKPAPTPAVGTSPASGTQTEAVSFTSQPTTIEVRPLPGGMAGTLLPAGTFRLVEQLSQATVAPGQSTAYEFRVEGEGNIAALPAPVVTPGSDFDIFPPEVRQLINRTGNPVTGQKSFRYFLIPRQKGEFSLRDTFRWVYFNTQTQRYDTLRPKTVLQVGSRVTTFDGIMADSVQTEAAGDASQHSIYSGISQLDSHQQPINLPILVRAMADVLIVVMLLGMIYIFFRK